MNGFSGVLLMHGEDITVTSGNTAVSTKALLIPRGVGYSDEMKTSPTVLGLRDCSRYLCILSGDITIGDIRKTVITYDGDDYEIINSQRFTVCKESSHWECVIRKREELFSDGN